MVLNSIKKCGGLLAIWVLSACDAPVAEQATARPAEAVEDVALTSVPTVASPTVTNSFAGGQFLWDSTGGLRYRYTAIERDGEIVICGAYARRGSSNSNKLSREVMRQATIRVGDEIVLRDLRYFAAVSNANWESGLVGVQTNCRGTGDTVSDYPLSAPQIYIRRGRYTVRV